MTHGESLPKGHVLEESANPGRRLRDQAEARLWRNSALTPEGIDNMPVEKVRQMVHELRVHQIELEMQNEELREAHVALDLIRARYFDLYDLAPVSYITISDKGLIAQVNLAAASLLSIPRRDLVNKAISKFIFREDQDVFYLKRKLLLETNESQSVELRLDGNNKDALWVKMEMSINRNESGASEIRAVLSNINERKLLEFKRASEQQVILHENIKLDQARVNAEKQNLAKSNCLSSMSHELRTPLNSILGFAQLLNSGTSKLTPIQDKNVGQIIQAGWYLLDLVNEILDLSQVESGHLNLSEDSIFIGSLLSECKLLVEPQAKERHIYLDFSSMTTMYIVKADYTRLKQVFINLLSNAIKYSFVGGTVSVSVEQLGLDRIRINIKDQGPGLSEGQIEHLFEPYNRLGQEKSSAQGTGIGLVVCKRLINLMGGIIGVDSNTQKGSNFWIKMPFINQ